MMHTVRRGLRQAAALSVKGTLKLTNASASIHTLQRFKRTPRNIVSLNTRQFSYPSHIKLGMPNLSPTMETVSFQFKIIKTKISRNVYSSYQTNSISFLG